MMFLGDVLRKIARGFLIHQFSRPKAVRPLGCCNHAFLKLISTMNEHVNVRGPILVFFRYREEPERHRRCISSAKRRTHPLKPQSNFRHRPRMTRRRASQLWHTIVILHEQSLPAGRTKRQRAKPILRCGFHFHRNPRFPIHRSVRSTLLTLTTRHPNVQMKRVTVLGR